MSGNGKTYRAALEKIDRNQRYLLEDSLALVKQTARAKFDETVELAIRLGVDPRQADQNIRGTVSLPLLRASLTAVPLDFKAVIICSTVA